MKRRRFRPTADALEARVPLSSSSNPISTFLNSVFPGLVHSNSSSSTPVHNLAYYEKLAPTNAKAAHIVQVYEQKQAKIAEMKAELAARHAHE